MPNSPPNAVAAILFSALFFTVSMVHTYQLIRTRTWWFIPFVVGGYLEWIGFVNRSITSYQGDTPSKAADNINLVFILVAPVWFAASIYILFGRLILLLDGNDLAIIKQKWLTAIFVCGDVASLIIQAAGASLLTGNNTNPNTLNIAKTVIDIGLVSQIVSFGIFITVASTFHWRVLKNPTPLSTSAQIPWRKHLYTVYLTSAIVMCRCIFRLIEYLLGTQGPIWQHESYQYVFDSSLMFGVMVSFAISHPSEVHALLKGGGTIAIGLRTKLHAGSINSEAACDLGAVEAVETVDVTNEVATSSFSPKGKSPTR